MTFNHLNAIAELAAITADSIRFSQGKTGLEAEIAHILALRMLDALIEIAKTSANHPESITR